MTGVAFLGAGTMGGPMARNLADAGFEVHLWNRSLEHAKPLSGGGIEVHSSPEEAASGCAHLVTMLSDAGAVLDCAGAALDALAPDAIWLQMATIGVEGTELCVAQAGRAGVDFVDAPVLGTREPAQQGKLVILASGADTALDRCDPLFAALGQRTLRVGTAGQGTAAKLVANNWTVGLTAVLAETVALATELGVDPQAFLDAIDGGPLDVPYAHIKGEMMLGGDFSDASFKLRLALKDAGLVLAAAEQHAVDLQVLRAVRERLASAERAGHGDEDMAAVLTAVGADHTQSGSRLHGGEL